jgi:hypothetical protein
MTFYIKGMVSSKTKLKQAFKSVTWPWIVAGLIVTLAIVLIVMHFSSSIKNQQIIANNNTPMSHCPDNMFCRTQSLQKEIIDPQQLVVQRDYRVLNDPLYPPLNRTDSQNTASLIENTAARNWNVPTNQSNDNYRLVGYLVSQEQKRDVGDNNWKLFARQKDRNTADFYMMPANNNYDVKIALKDDTVVGTRLRDVYTIPDQLQFNSPLLNNGSYQFVENPKADLSSPGYI